MTLIAGQAIFAGDALYIASADGKAYRAESNAAGEKVENFIGFASTAAAIGANVAVKTGPTIDGLSGLSPGSVYYLSSPGAISTIPGFIHKPAGVATGATSLYMFPVQAYRTFVYYGTLPNPAINNVQDFVVTVGFRPRVIAVNGQMLICNAAGSQCECKTFQYSWESTINKGGTWAKGASGSCTSVTSMGYDTTNPSVQTSSASNDSKLTFLIHSILTNGIVFRLSNTIVSGSGSSNAQMCSVTVHMSG
jgi:hypothetical protein